MRFCKDGRPHRWFSSLLIMTGALLASRAEAQEAAPAEAPAAAPGGDAALESTMTFQTGRISLAGGKVELALPEGYRYLGPKATEQVLVAWGNPPGTQTLGMLLPDGAGPLAGG